MVPTRFFVLFEKEFREFFSSRAWIITFIFPLFVAFIFATVYREENQTEYRIAYLQSAAEPQMIKYLSSAGLKTIPFANLIKAKQALAEGQVDGVLTQDKGAPKHEYLLLVPGSESPKASMIMNQINLTLLQIYSNDQIPHIKLTLQGKTLDIRRLALPLWLIQIILTVCLLQNTAVIAEEKSKQTLHSLLVTPVTIREYISAKMVWNTFITLSSVLLTIGVTRISIDFLQLILFVISGCVVYSTAAIMIGLFSPNTVFARTISTLVYLLSSIPLMTKNSALSWQEVLNYFPTFAIHFGLEKAVLQSSISPESLVQLGLLWIEAFLLLLLTSYILKRKTDL